MPSGEPSKKLSGRPRKHATKEAAAEAKREANRRWYQRSHEPGRPADFIAFEPPTPNLPIDTPPSGLRTSSDVRIPLDDDARQAEVSEPVRPSPSRTRQHPLRDEDAQLAAQVRQIQIDEEESNLERGEYDAAISQRLSEMEVASAEILMGMRGVRVPETSVLPGEEALADSSTTTEFQKEGSDIADNGVGEREKEPLDFCFSTAACIDEPIVYDSFGASAPSNIPANIQRSHESTVPPQTPGQKTPSMHSSSQSTGRQSSSKGRFPSQTNNLMSWVTSVPQRQPTGISPTTTPSTASRSSSNALSSSPCRIERAASLPVQAETHVASHPATPSNPSPMPAAPPSPHPRTPIDTATVASSTPAPAERTAIKLAKQLRHFQGCTHEQHREADRLHEEHHQRPDIHSRCSSLQQITEVLRGAGGENPLPDVLAEAKAMKVLKPMDFGGLDPKAAFEGTSPSAASNDIGTPDENLPMNLCLSTFYSASRKNRHAKEAFDIDSTSCFPTSLAIARKGIYWYPGAHPILNLSADIHFGLRVPSYNQRGAPTQKYTPLHKIPHYCIGSLMGMKGMDLLVFFPALHMESDYEHSTYLSDQDFELWYDAILAPAIHATVRSSNLLLHMPASARIIRADGLAMSTESLARKESAQEQLLAYAIQGQYLDALWTTVLERIAANPGCRRFHGATLFMHSKNTKLEHMKTADRDLMMAYDDWESSWSQATDPQFYNKDRTFVDLAKQITSEDSDLPYDLVPEDHEAEVYLWKKCCLDAYAKTRTILSADGSPAKGNPLRRTYNWAMMRDTMGQTFFAAPQGKETRDGLIYSQFYVLIKTPFDTSKVYVFDNESLENLALDPGYIRSLQQEGGGITFSKRVCEFAYLRGKNRAHVNLVDNRWRSYGVREEHRISLTMMEEIYQQWRQWELYDDEIEAAGPLPYYTIPTKDLLDFLYAQINKYCFLFEHVLAHTAMTYSLPETIVMVTALRALRFCYCSNLLQRESLLYKDRWEVLKNEKLVTREGLGMRDTIDRCGLGWFLPKFNWATWRFAPPHGENILVGNMLMHEEYRRRWRAVKDLRDVYIRFNQAESWFERYSVGQSAPLLDKWLEYLHVLNLEQFDADIWKAMLRSNKRSPELISTATAQQGKMQFCHADMKHAFSINGTPIAPHFVTGNKMRFERVGELLNFLFLWEDGQDRPGWGSKPYRTILEKTFKMLERRLGYRRADRWLDEFLHLVRLTHWVLPYASNAALITITKTSRSQNLQGRMMWFSAVYADPAKVALPFRSQPRTLYDILWAAQREVFGDGRDQHAWSASQLIKACRNQGLKMVGQDDTDDFWVVGKKSAGLKGFVPLWERTRPPKLKMMEQIKGKSLDELEDLMSGFSRDSTGDDEQDSAMDGQSDSDNNSAGAYDRRRSHDSISTSRSIMARFARSSRNDRVRRSVVFVAASPDRPSSTGGSSTSGGIMARFARQESVSKAGSSGSEFIPSASGTG
jgi:hypothetical protein